MGVWIEIISNRIYYNPLDIVTPYMGVWIEIKSATESANALKVTPYKGVWIEIDIILFISSHTASLPTWECGLKLMLD